MGGETSFQDICILAAVCSIEYAHIEFRFNRICARKRLWLSGLGGTAGEPSASATRHAWALARPTRQPQPRLRSQPANSTIHACVNRMVNRQSLPSASLIGLSPVTEDLFAKRSSLRERTKVANKMGPPRSRVIGQICSRRDSSFIHYTSTLYAKAVFSVFRTQFSDPRGRSGVKFPCNL